MFKIRQCVYVFLIVIVVLISCDNSTEYDMAPNIPENIQIEQVGSTILIRWDTLASNSIVEYEIYQINGEKYSLIGSTRSDQYIINEYTEGYMYFRIRSKYLDENMLVSDYSDVVSILATYVINERDLEALYLIKQNNMDAEIEWEFYFDKEGINPIDVKKHSDIILKSVNKERRVSILNLAHYKNIKNLSFLSKLEELTSLDVSNSGVNHLDLKRNINLEELYCRGNKITNLDLSFNLKLNKVFCENNNIINLDLGYNSNLRTIVCNNNELVAIYLDNLRNLEILDCSKNNIKLLKLNNNLTLKTLVASDNKLTAVDISNNLKAETIYIENNKIRTLNFSNNKLLEKIYCAGNLLTQLDVSNNVILSELDCINNALSPNTVILLSSFLNRSQSTTKYNKDYLMPEKSSLIYKGVASHFSQ